MKFSPLIAAVFLSCIVASPAQARNTEVFIDADTAVENQAKGDLLDIPFYMKGQKHPKVIKKIGNWSSSRKGRGVLQSDEAACSRTFVSAIKSLQQRAVREGGDAIINITTWTKDVPYEDAEKFRCVAGAVVVHVAIKGDIVKLAD